MPASTVSVRTYNLALYAYCGMAVPLVEGGDLAECRQRAARRIRCHRNRYDSPVTVLEPGRKWELESPDHAFMVGDHEGVLSLQTAETEGNDTSDSEEDQQ